MREDMTKLYVAAHIFKNKTVLRFGKQLDLSLAIENRKLKVLYATCFKIFKTEVLIFAILLVNTLIK